MRQKGFTPILIVIILALVGIVGAYYFGIKKGNIMTTITENPPSIATNTPTQITPTTKSTTDPTANWKTYKSSLYSYSVKYPSDWNVVETKHNAASVIDSSKQKVMTELSNNKSSIKIFYEGDWDHGFEPWVFKSSNKVDVGGKEANINTLTLDSNPNEWTIYIIDNFHDFRIEALVAPSDKNISGQIISTLKFIQ